MKSALFTTLMLCLISSLFSTAYGQSDYCTDDVDVFVGSNCQVMLLPEMVLSDGWETYEEGIDITVIDSDTTNGGLVDGVGELAYEVICLGDSCDGFETCWGIIQVLDTISPLVACDTLLNVEIPPHQFGKRIYASEIGPNISDNCQVLNVTVSRNNYDPSADSCGDDFSEPAGYIDFFCCDVGQQVTVTLHIEAEGFSDNCQVVITPQQSSVENCGNTMQDTVVVDITSLNPDFDPYQPAYLDEYTDGIYSIVDNCNTYVEEYTPTVQFDECNSGLIIRNFVIRDNATADLIGVCNQFIRVNYIQDYIIKLPKDYTLSCGQEPIEELTYQSAEYSSLGITSNYSDELLESDSVLLRHWFIIDWCQYDGESPPTEIGRDEDCDGQEGEEGLYLIAQTDGQVYLDRDSLPFNQIPAAIENSCNNSAGHWSSLPFVNGYYTYTQKIKIENNVQPVIVSNLEYCAGDNCKKDIDFEFELMSCIDHNILSNDSLSIEVAIDFNQNNTEDHTATPVLNDNIYSALMDDVPLGEHQISIRITNQAGIISTFDYTITVEACGLVAPPVCKSEYQIELVYSDLEVNYNLLADVLLESPATSCGSDLIYSVNHSGNEASQYEDYLTLYCEDEGETLLEVWAWDDNGNSASCEATVIITDPLSLCDSLVHIDKPQLIVHPLSEPDYEIGDTLDFAIQARNMTGLVSAQFAVSWDSAYLNFAGISNLNDEVFTNLDENLISTPHNNENIDEGIVKMLWFDPLFGSVDIGHTAEDVFHLQLLVKDCGNTAVAISDLSPFVLIEIFTFNNNDFDLIDPVLYPAHLTSDCSTPTESTPSVHLSIPEVQTNAGDTVCLPVQADTFNQVFAFDFSINYDPEDLHFTGIQNFTDSLPNFDLGGSFGLPGQGSLEEGQINVLYWLGEDNYSFSGTTTLFDVCFEAQNQGSACAPVTFSGLSTEDAGFYTTIGDMIPSTLVDGTVQIAQEVAYQLCPDESMNINGTTYDQNHLNGTEIFDGSLCDSMVNIQLVYGYTDTSYLQAQLNAGDIFEWNGESYDQPGTFTQLYTNESGCDSLVILQLDIVNSTSAISSLPLSQSNAITPNNDGLNEFFVIEMLEQQPAKHSNNELIIFNRAGQIVYQASPYNNQWSGKDNKNQNLPTGTYYYLFRPDNNQKSVYKGDVTIIR